MIIDLRCFLQFLKQFIEVQFSRIAYLFEPNLAAGSARVMISTVYSKFCEIFLILPSTEYLGTEFILEADNCILIN
jgi:hypothetical protein